MTEPMTTPLTPEQFFGLMDELVSPELKELINMCIELNKITEVLRVRI